MHVTDEVWKELAHFELHQEVGIPGQKTVDALSRSIGQVLQSVEYGLLKLPDDIDPEKTDDTEQWDAMGFDYGLDSIRCHLKGCKSPVMFAWNWEVLNFELSVSHVSDRDNSDRYRRYGADHRPCWVGVVGNRVVDVATGWIHESDIQYFGGSSLPPPFRGASYALTCVALRFESGSTVFITNANVETGKLNGEYDEVAVIGGAQTKRLGLVGTDGRFAVYSWFRLPV